VKNFYRGFIFLFAFCFSTMGWAQIDTAKQKRENVMLHPDKFYRKFFPNLKIKSHPPDSNFIKVYPNYLSAGLHVLSPVIHLNISPAKGVVPGFSPSSKFRTNISDVIGFSASYRFITAGFAFLANSGMHMHDDYSPSRYRTATIKYGGRAFNFQFKYIRIKGFTDIQQHEMGGDEYILRPDMVSKEFQFEGLYNFSWKRYSYVAPINFSQHQIRSHAGFLLKSGVYYQQLYGASPILSTEQQPYYSDFSESKALRMLSIRFAPGVGVNVVALKKVYLSMATFTSFDLCVYKFLDDLDDKVSANRDFVFLLDNKLGVGYHSTRFYAGMRYDVEARSSVLSDIDLGQIYHYIGIELGYRFKAPRIVKKIYKKTMPPGM
jgi:hypothetical protein